MDREIKFRGIRIDGKGWVYGNFERCENFRGTIYYQVGYGKWYYRIIPETLGQFTGLKDKNCVEIYEGDIESSGGVIKLGIYEMFSDRSGVPTWISEKKNMSSFVLMCNSDFKIKETIIGNIHESPELLNTK